MSEGHEYMLIRFWIRDGEREYNHFVICRKDGMGSADDADLIKIYISDNMTECISKVYNEEDERIYWVHYMEALCKVEKRYSISRETKELLNNFGVY